MSKVIKHFFRIIRIGVWRNLSKIGIGDPLNQLVYVAKYRPYRRTK